MRRFRYAVIVLVLGTAAACTSDAKTEPSDQPSTPASTSTSATQSATPPIVRSPSPSVATTGPNVRPGETVPVLPTLAKTNSRPGAAAFAAYWFETLDWAYATTDTALTKTLYSAQCATCRSLTGLVDAVAAKNQHYVGGRLGLGDRQIVSGDKQHPNATAVDVYFSVQAVKTVRSDGSVVAKGASLKDLRWRIWLVAQPANGWEAIDLKRIFVR